MFYVSLVPTGFFDSPLARYNAFRTRPAAATLFSPLPSSPPPAPSPEPYSCLTVESRATAHPHRAPRASTVTELRRAAARRYSPLSHTADNPHGRVRERDSAHSGRPFELSRIHVSRTPACARALLASSLPPREHSDAHEAGARMRTGSGTSLDATAPPARASGRRLGNSGFQALTSHPALGGTRTSDPPAL